MQWFFRSPSTIQRAYPPSAIGWYMYCYLIFSGSGHAWQFDYSVVSFSFLAGPTSFAPIIEMAMTIVEQNGGQYHVLLIIADGQVYCLQFISF